MESKFKAVNKDRISEQIIIRSYGNARIIGFLDSDNKRIIYLSPSSKGP